MRHLLTILLLVLPSSAKAQGVSVDRLQGLLKPIDIGSVSVNSLFDKIFNLLILIAAILAIFYLVWAGIQFIIASGDPEKAKKARDAIVHAIIGIVVIVLSYAIITWTRAVVEEGLNGQSQVENQRVSQQSTQAGSQLAGSVPRVGSALAGQGASTATTQVGQPGPLVTSGFTNVSYSSNGFSPANIRVQSGTLVTFKNNTNSTAELMAFPGANSNSDLNIGTLSERQVLMQQKGTWRYYNPQNPNQQGIITVE